MINMNLNKNHEQLIEKGNEVLKSLRKRVRIVAVKSVELNVVSIITYVLNNNKEMVHLYEKNTLKSILVQNKAGNHYGYDKREGCVWRGCTCMYHMVESDKRYELNIWDDSKKKEVESIIEECNKIFKEKEYNDICASQAWINEDYHDCVCFTINDKISIYADVVIEKEKIKIKALQGDGIFYGSWDEIEDEEELKSYGTKIENMLNEF